VGRRDKAEEDCVGQVGYSVPTKGERVPRNQGHQEVQSCSSLKMEMESIPSLKGTVGSGVGFKVWRLEEFG